jgi:hypothetical protein
MLVSLVMRETGVLEFVQNVIADSFWLRWDVYLQVLC